MTPEAPNVLHPKLSSKFDVWDPSEMILFHKNRKIGANKVDLKMFVEKYFHSIVPGHLGCQRILPDLWYGLLYQSLCESIRY